MPFLPRSIYGYQELLFLTPDHSGRRVCNSARADSSAPSPSAVATGLRCDAVPSLGTVIGNDARSDWAEPAPSVERVMGSQKRGPGSAGGCRGFAVRPRNMHVCDDFNFSLAFSHPPERTAFIARPLFLLRHTRTPVVSSVIYIEPFATSTGANQQQTIYLDSSSIALPAYSPSSTF